MSTQHFLQSLLQKDISFQRLSDPDTSSAQSHDIVLVHGFASSAFSHYRLALEKAVIANTRSQFSPVITFRFDLNSLLSGAPGSFANEVQRLRRHLLRVYEGDPDQAGSTISPSSTSTDNDQDAISKSSEPPMKTLIFIVHGLASWIVRDVLASRSSRNIGFMPLGIIHLDCPEPTLGTVNRLDVEFLQQFFAVFRQPRTFGSAQDLEQLKRLQVSLDQADNNFRRHTTVYREQRREQGLSERQREIYQTRKSLWVSDSHNMPEDNNVGWIQWVRSSWYRQTVTPMTPELAYLPDLIQAVLQHASKQTEHEDYPDSSDDESDDDKNFRRARIEESGRNNARIWIKNQDGVEIEANNAPTDLQSILSSPKHDDALRQNDQPMKILEMGYSYFKRCELTTAESLYSLCREKLPRTEAPTIEYVYVNMQIMAVHFYLGKYNETLSELKNIKKMINRSVIEKDTQGKILKELHRDRRRWHGKLLMQKGDWTEAAQKFEKLLEEDPCDESGKTQRDLALVYAYLGCYDQAYATIQSAEQVLRTQYGLSSKVELAKDADVQEARLKENTSGESSVAHADTVARETDSLPLELKKAGIQTATAEIHLLSGRYAEALQLSTDAFNDVTSTTDKKHLKALTLANLKASCLAANVQYTVAEALCLSTLEIITQTLGRKHPLCLEAMRILVLIFRNQSRFAEAIGTAKSLRKLAAAQLSEKHPLTLRARYELAAAYLGNGDYRKASYALESLVTDVKASPNFGYFHPESLLYQSELARARLCCGRVSDAKALALETIVHQIHIYRYQEPVSGGIKQIRGLITCSQDTCPSGGYYQFVSERLCHDGEQTNLSFRMHPFWLSTIQTIASIECKLHGDGATESELPALESLLGEITNRLPEPSAFIQLALAHVLQEPIGTADDDRLDQAIEALEKVVDRRTRDLGQLHMDTLCACREMMIAYCMRSVSRSVSDQASDILVDAIERRSLAIMDSLESTLGIYHPESLRSGLWYMTIKLLNTGSQGPEYNDEESETEDPGDIFNVMERMLERLRTPSVRDERLVESLEMERSVAMLLLGSTYPNTKLCPILRDTLASIRIVTTECAGVEAKLEEIERTLEEMLSKAERQENET